MSLNLNRIIVTNSEWVQISEDEDANVTVDNLGTYPYQIIQVASGPTMPTGDVGGYKTIGPQSQQTLTNIDEGAILWVRAVSSFAVPVEVITG